MKNRIGRYINYFEDPYISPQIIGYKAIESSDAMEYLEDNAIRIQKSLEFMLPFSECFQQAIDIYLEESFSKPTKVKNNFLRGLLE